MSMFLEQIGLEGGLKIVESKATRDKRMVARRSQKFRRCRIGGLERLMFHRQGAQLGTWGNRRSQIRNHGKVFERLVPKVRYVVLTDHIWRINVEVQHAQCRTSSQSFRGIFNEVEMKLIDLSLVPPTSDGENFKVKQGFLRVIKSKFNTRWES
jgi:hypothetical protein